ncbi:hypothetical protein LIMU106485_07980 [Limosilactobacillus mucosae]
MQAIKLKKASPYRRRLHPHMQNDFKYTWLAHQPYPKTLSELEDLVKRGVEYFNTVEISSKCNNLTAEDYRNEVA